MTLNMDICPGTAQRTEAARQLIVRARDGELVDLAVVSAMDLCGLVAELSAGLPPDREAGFRVVTKPGPLGWVYRYLLLSPEQAAEVLARWTISPPARAGRRRTAGYLVSVGRPDGEESAGVRVRVRGDGARAQLNGPGPHEEAGHDLAGLRAVMLGLMISARTRG